MSAEVKERMKLLSQERAAVKETWENRNKLLKQCTDIQVCSDHCNMYSHILVKPVLYVHTYLL